MTEVTIDSFRGDFRRTVEDRAIGLVLLGFAGLSLVIGTLIITSLAGEAWTFVSQVDPSSLWTQGWFPRRGLYDLKTLIAGSTLITSIAMVVAIPLGGAAAIYMSEFAGPRVRRILRPVFETLAGIPSVVLGFFALTWISPQVVQRFNSQAELFNITAAGIAVGILTVPLIASVAEDALRSVPTDIRYASYALGASEATTSLRVVIPAAVSGLVAAMILAVSRAVGETMIVFIAAGGVGGSLFSIDPFGTGQTMTAAIAAQATGTDRVAGAGLTFQSLFFVGLVLFVSTFALNLVSNRLVRRARHPY